MKLVWHPDHTAFLNDLKQTSLVTYPPESLSHLVDLYDSTLSNLLDKHAPIVTKRSARATPSQPWFTDSLRTARRECRHAESAYRSTRSYFDYAAYKTLRYRYHKLVVAEKKLITYFWSLTPLAILGANGTLLTAFYIATQLIHCITFIGIPFFSCQSVCHILQRENLTASSNSLCQPCSVCPLSISTDFTS